MINHKRSGLKVMSQINVVPYIDVMLVLLVIFMVTAPMINPGQVELPKVSQSSVPPVQPMVVFIHKEGSLGLRDRNEAGSEQRVNREALIHAIRLKQKKHPDQAVVIEADKSVRYEAVLEVMDVLQQNQVAKVGLLVKPKSDLSGNE
jgi:biopolymer transport protein TolR